WRKIPAADRRRVSADRRQAHLQDRDAERKSRPRHGSDQPERGSAPVPTDGSVAPVLAPRRSEPAADRRLSSQTQPAIAAQATPAIAVVVSEGKLKANPAATIGARSHGRTMPAPSR